MLLAREGYPAREIASRVRCSERTVRRWRQRYEREGIEGLTDQLRSGRPLTHGPEVRACLPMGVVEALNSRLEGTHLPGAGANIRLGGLGPSGEEARAAEITLGKLAV